MIESTETRVTKVKTSSRLPLSLRHRGHIALAGGRVVEVDLWWTTASYWNRFGPANTEWGVFPIGPFVVAYRVSG